MLISTWMIVGALFLSVLWDIKLYRYDRRFMRGLRNPRALLCGLAVAGLVVGFSASDLSWSVAPVAAMAFVAVVIWVAGREEARRQAAAGGRPKT